MELLTRNSKIKKSTDKRTFNFGIPAFKAASGFKTCPNAAACAKGCYATQGAYIWSTVAKAFEARLELARDPKRFIPAILSELDRKKVERLRVHDSGDFFSQAYLDSWKLIARARPNVEFYAYTKMVSMLRGAQTQPDWPRNFKIIYSFGGTQDKLIDVKRDRHSFVFSTHEEREAAGYADATVDDSVALGTNPKIGLVYHGAKNLENTDWLKVKRK